jgi:sigma-B regulation protein RsbU (phosphoserine phosphatase)
MHAPATPSPRFALGAGILALGAGGLAIALLVAAPAQRGATITVIVASLVFGAAAIIRLARIVLAYRRALTHVATQAEKLARGEAIDNTDPAALVAVNSLERVGGRVKQLVEARAHVVATERDLDRARSMYRSILPLASVARHQSVRVAGVCRPAAETGGDWWTYRKLSGGRMLVVVGDATGHGVYSAMIGCAAHGAVEALSQVGEERLTPSSVLKAINEAIRIPGADTVAMTCFAALFDPAQRVIEFANASHMLPLVASSGPDGTIINVGALGGGPVIDRDQDSDIMPAGIRPGAQRLDPGDVVLLFTDGIVERRDRAGKQFGYRRLQQSVQQCKLELGDQGIAAMRDAIMGKLDAFAGKVAADDDITIVVCAMDR